MTLTVCFDALGTCFTLHNIIGAVDKQYGEELAKKGLGSKGFVLDWFHSAQRDYTYLSLISPPPPPIASILKTSLPSSLSSALSIQPPSSSDLESITSLLSSLPPSPTLKEAFSHLSQNGAKIAIVTNGAKSTTEGYASKAGVAEYVEKVISCDDVGYAKPHKEVYDAANKLCVELEDGKKGERWFVAAHLWDLAAAKQAGFKTGLVLSDFPEELVDNDEQDESLKEWYKTYGGRPDIVGKTLMEVAQAIIKSS
ncbi:haloacid dehalogenase, type II [Kwoniella bestiolae CBS 10118]|uniref:Haloacid dehalogenase, type II n=1 Tax=Kwoniella bestiolae CBS 10118 TaxID=1296100 RepID=A0A1B9FZI1_9TREE|nr:haloacid dehalogenase, type II [Kwoniella bestiolae CBS 10118]OCF24177.1 haloacid dehalogenase, type II [Kwoniella bestiolae CBS 10118]